MPQWAMANSLRAWRLARGLTQVELARRAGIPQPMVSRFETGTHEPKGLITALALARVLDVPVSELWEESPTVAPTGSAQITAE